ncbi:MAG: L-fucose:H+ symporter permease [Lentisphaeria bacterium]|nr:L-fucose:H+ symporter permease [Lentisphaeria bacterium]
MTAPKTSAPIVSRKILWPFILITSCFAWWGLANNMTDTLLAAFKKIMSMSDFQTSWIQIAFYGSYFCLALPGAILIKKYSYKTGVLLGLGMFIFGSLLFYPASQTMNYYHFLTALFILAGGLTVLETAADPYVISLGSEETATRRLNLAQSFNPCGSILGVILSKLFILCELNKATASERSQMGAEQLHKIQADELSAVMGPYVGVAVVMIVLWFLIAFTRMPKGECEIDAQTHKRKVELMPTLKRLFANKHYVFGVLVQFFYVGAQIGVWSYTIRYVMKETGLAENGAATYYLWALILFTASRFVCTFLMRYISPGKLLTYFASSAIACCLVVSFIGGYPGVYALVGISICMSLMFPTIFGLTVSGLGKDTQIGASGLVMAILGGAVITSIQGQVSDLTGSIRLAFLVPAICFVVIAIYGSMGCKNRSAADMLTHN